MIMEVLLYHAVGEGGGKEKEIANNKSCLRFLLVLSADNRNWEWYSYWNVQQHLLVPDVVRVINTFNFSYPPPLKEWKKDSSKTIIFLGGVLLPSLQTQSTLLIWAFFSGVCVCECV